MTDCPNSWLTQQENEKLTFSSELCAFSYGGGGGEEKREGQNNNE